MEGDWVSESGWQWKEISMRGIKSEGKESTAASEAVAGRRWTSSSNAGSDK